VAKNDDKGERLGSLELVPKDGIDRPSTGKSVFHPNTRDKGDRRTKSDDRRGAVRTTTPRRTKARRPAGPWDGVKPK
jgi:hypothetical protein